MLDVHEKIVGIFPYIFGISTYSIFVTLGILSGLLYYLVDTKRNNMEKRVAIYIVTSGLFFGFIGSKIPLLFENKSLIQILFGKSIIGGLIGGLLGVLFIKKVLKINLKLGNIIAPAIALGMAIGRIGCFFNGCCFGKVYIWGFDFGDGNLRIPTQLFEVIFNLIAFFLLHYYKNKVKTKGLLFKLYLIVYFIFRFIIEFIRENPIVWVGLTVYQIICVFGIIYILFYFWRTFYYEKSLS